MMNGITEIAESLSSELKRRLPKQRKTQRTKLALLVSTMLDVRSANLMDLAAGLPLEADRTDMRYQWIVRLLGNPLVISDAIMEPFAREVLERAGADGEPLGLILDQSKVSDRHQVLMLALRWGERALPLAWRVEETEGAIGFETQKALLEVVVPWLPAPARVRLLGDRFYGTADLIGWCQQRGWDYRLRLKGNLAVFDATGRTTTGQCARDRVYYLEDVELTGRRARTHIGIIHDPGHAEPWIIAMSENPGYLRTLEYSARWGIEPMFSDFKSRGFGIEDTQLRYADRLDRLILVMALALYVAVSTGQWDAVHHPTPSEKKSRGPTEEGRPKQNLLVHPRTPPHRQADAIMFTASSTLERDFELIDAKRESLNSRSEPTTTDRRPETSRVRAALCRESVRRAS